MKEQKSFLKTKNWRFANLWEPLDCYGISLRRELARDYNTLILDWYPLREYICLKAEDGVYRIHHSATNSPFAHIQEEEEEEEQKLRSGGGGVGVLYTKFYYVWYVQSKHDSNLIYRCLRTGCSSWKTRFQQVFYNILELYLPRCGASVLKDTRCVSLRNANAFDLMFHGVPLREKQTHGKDDRVH